MQSKDKGDRSDITPGHTKHDRGDAMTPEERNERTRQAFKKAGIGGGRSGRLNTRERERLCSLLGRWSEEEAPDGRLRDMVAAIIFAIDNPDDA